MPREGEKRAFFYTIYRRNGTAATLLFFNDYYSNKRIKIDQNNCK